MAEKKITSLADLKKYSKGVVVEFPSFGEGQPFVARIRRPSLMKLAVEGKIPNELLTKANELFASDGSGINPKESNMMQNIKAVIDIIAEASFIEPTYSEIKENVGLTDDQMMFLFNYTQQGVKALSDFRTDKEN